MPLNLRSATGQHDAGRDQIFVAAATQLSLDQGEQLVVARLDHFGQGLMSLMSRLGWETVNTTTAAFVLLSLWLWQILKVNRLSVFLTLRVQWGSGLARESGVSGGTSVD